MKYFILLASIIVLLSSCGPSQKIVKKAPAEQAQTSQYDERFDPLSLNDDDIVIEAGNKKETKQVREDVLNRDADKENLIEQEVDGWRVQIFVSNNFESATVKQEQAKSQFKEEHYNVYLIFETPYYKIRVGDFVNRQEAEELRDKAREMGYKQAFLVPSKVMVSAER